MVNIEELRQKYNQINNRGQGATDPEFLKKFFMMEEGTSQVRVLPSKDEEIQFYSETAIHRINNKNHHCPRVKDQKCPICDVYYKMWKRITEMGGRDVPAAQPLIEAARKIKAYRRYYMNIVDRRDESVKILSVGQKLFGKVLDSFFDDDYGDITDLKDGWDFKIVKETQGQWPNYDKSGPKPKSSVAGTDSEVATWMDELHDIHGLVKVADYEELQTMALDIDSAVFGAPVSSGTPTGTPEEGDDDYLSHLKNLDVD